MLTLKPGDKTEVTFRHRESRFSPDFLKGLLLALLFHLFLFTFFRLAPERKENAPVLPFTQAIAEIDPHAVVQVTLPEFSIISFEEAFPRMIPDFVPAPSCLEKGIHSSVFDIEPDFSPLEKTHFIPLDDNYL